MPFNPRKSGTCQVTLNILGYREESEWVALALEMDLRGCGKTFEFWANRGKGSERII